MADDLAWVLITTPEHPTEPSETPTRRRTNPQDLFSRVPQGYVVPWPQRSIGTDAQRFA